MREQRDNKSQEINEIAKYETQMKQLAMRDERNI